jgi:hypothetical protein
MIIVYGVVVLLYVTWSDYTDVNLVEHDDI